MKLEQIAIRNVAVLNPDDTLNSAIQKMWRLKIRHLPVVVRGVPIGMISERDVLLHQSWHEPDRLESTQDVRLEMAIHVESVMTSPAVVLSLDEPVAKAARLMLNKRISAIPLMSGETIFGIVTETDFLKCFLRENVDPHTNSSRQSNVFKHMSARVFSVESEEATLTAIRLMRNKQLRHLPVVDNG